MTESATTSRLRQQVICVLGMHRSGTSPIARIVSLLGVYLGPEDRLLEPAPDNPKGFWEYRKFYEINDELLTRLGGSWQEPPALPEQWEAAPELADLRRRARAAIREEFSSCDVWGWKDPRACLTLPFWQNLLPPMRYVICLRNPVDVAHSLARRDHLPADRAFDLWSTYVQSALEHTTGQPRLFVFYDDLMDDWLAELRTIAAFLGKPGLAEEGEIQAAVRELLEEELRHHRTSAIDVLDDAELAFPTKALYLAQHLYGRLSRGAPAPPDDDSGLIDASLNVFARYAGQAQTEVDGLRTQVVERDQLVHRLHLEAADREQALEALRAELAEREQAAGVLRAQVAERDQLVHRLHLEAADREQALGTLRAELAERDQLAALRAELAERDRLADGLSLQVAERDRTELALRSQLREITESPYWRLAEALARGRSVLAPTDSLRYRALLVAVTRASGGRIVVPPSRPAARDGVGVGVPRPASPNGPEVRAQNLRIQPLISLLMLAEGAEAASVDRTLESVRAQAYPRWELLVCGPEPADQEARWAVARYVAMDPRIRRLAGPSGRSGAAALNGALEDASGELVGVVHPGDELSRDVLHALVAALDPAALADVVYGDEDWVDEAGTVWATVAKPDWSPELALAYPYAGRPCLLRREMVVQLGGWRDDTLAAEEYELVLRAAAYGAFIAHVGQVLYHRRRPARDLDWAGTPAVVAARRRALEDHLSAIRLPAEVVDVGGPARLRVRCQIADRPLVSIIIPTRDRVDLLRQCIRSIEAQTDHEPYEIVIVDNDSTDPETLAYLAECGHRVVPSPGPFNFAAEINAGARAARGDYLLLLNNDTEVTSPEWLSAMLEWAQQPAIGCVGAKLLFRDGRLQHVGVVVRDGAAHHPLYGQRPGAGNGWMDAELIRNYAAVTAACLLVRRSIFEEVGGFDEAFAVCYNDVDFCLRVFERGHRNVYTPYAVLYHQESASRESPGVVTVKEMERLRAAHGALLWNDPYAAPTASAAIFRSAGR